MHWKLCDYDWDKKKLKNLNIYLVKSTFCIRQHEKIKKFILLESLSDELKTVVVIIDMSANLNQITALLQKIDNKQRAMLSSIRKSYSDTFKSPVPTMFSPVVALRTPVADSVAAASSIINDFDVMNLSISRYRPKITSAEKVRRMSENLCMYYEGARHYTNNCALNSKNKRVTISELIVIVSISKKKEKFSS